MELGEGTKAVLTSFRGRTPLHFAAARGHTSIVKLLVSQGATPDPRGNSGRRPSIGWSFSSLRPGKTPADEAEANGHKEIAELLQSGDAGHLVRLLAAKQQHWPVERLIRVFGHVQAGITAGGHTVAERQGFGHS